MSVTRRSQTERRQQLRRGDSGPKPPLKSGRGIGSELADGRHGGAAHARHPRAGDGCSSTYPWVHGPAAAEACRRHNRSWQAARVQRSVAQTAPKAPATRGPTARHHSYQRSRQPRNRPKMQRSPVATGPNVHLVRQRRQCEAILWLFINSTYGRTGSPPTSTWSGSVASTHTGDLLTTGLPPVIHRRRVAAINRDRFALNLPPQTRSLDRLGDRRRRPVENCSETMPGRLADGEHRIATGNSCRHANPSDLSLALLDAGPVAARGAPPDGVRNWPRPPAPAPRMTRPSTHGTAPRRRHRRRTAAGHEEPDPAGETGYAGRVTRSRPSNARSPGTSTAAR